VETVTLNLNTKLMKKVRKHIDNEKLDSVNGAFVDILRKFKIRKEKTKSQVLRSVLYKIWQTNPDGHDDPDEFYSKYMDQIIEYYKQYFNQEETNV